ncbi:ATP-binding protein [Streptomyces sp. NPDC001102]
MELAVEQAAEEIETWLAAPGGPYETLAIRGLPGSGKTELLRLLAAWNPRAVFVDCQGMTTEEVAHRLLAAWGVTESYGSLVSKPWMSAPTRNDLLLTSARGGEDRDDGRVPELAGLVEQCPALGALARTAPARSWLDASFGQGTCRRLPESALPIDLVHEGSRHSAWPYKQSAAEHHALFRHAGGLHTE